MTRSPHRGWNRVHPLTRTAYVGRLSVAVFILPPALLILHHLGRTPAVMVTLLVYALAYPHLAFLIAYLGRNPRRAELRMLAWVDPFVLTLWLPALHFNPLLLIVFLLTTGSVGLSSGGFRMLFQRLASGLLGALAGGLALGFTYTPYYGWALVTTAGMAILVAGFAPAYLAYRGTRTIVRTRKALKEERNRLKVEQHLTRQALDERNRADAHLHGELAEAARYVAGMLPAPMAQGPVRADWRFIPSAALGGDLFGYHWLDSRRLAVYVLDVSGHGVGAALMSVTVNDALRLQTLAGVDYGRPAEVLGGLNRVFRAERHNHMFVTLWYGVCDPMDRTLVYASAGHPPALLRDASEGGATLKELRTPNPAIGVAAEVTIHQAQTGLAPGAALYVYSDGAYEIRRRNGTMATLAEFQERLLRAGREGAGDLDRLVEEARSMTHQAVLEDDFTVVKLIFD